MVTLYAKGARAVLVPNTVDVTEIPTINYLPSILRGYLRGKVLQFNIELALALDRIQTTLPQLRLYRVDFYAKVNGILSHASRYGFTETEIDALADVTLLDKSFDGPGSRYVFWDPIHPTTKAHGLIADWFQAVVAPMQPRCNITGRETDVVVTLTNLHVDELYAMECSTNLQQWSESARLTVYDDHGAQFTPTNHLPREFFRTLLLP